MQVLSGGVFSGVADKGNGVAAADNVAGFFQQRGIVLIDRNNIVGMLNYYHVSGLNRPIGKQYYSVVDCFYRFVFGSCNVDSEMLRFHIKSFDNLSSDGSEKEVAFQIVFRSSNFDRFAGFGRRFGYLVFVSAFHFGTQNRIFFRVGIVYIFGKGCGCRQDGYGI